MKKILFLSIAILLSSFSFAEKKSLIVIDKNTKEELIGAKIIVNDTTYYTDFNGIVVIDTQNDSTITIEYPSYTTKTIIFNESKVIELKSK